VGALLPFGAPVGGAVATWVGILIAMPVVLATIPGDHNLWPIVLVMGGVLTGVSVALALVVAAGLRAIFQKPSRR